jgi:hypothetical protein
MYGRRAASHSSKKLSNVCRVLRSSPLPALTTCSPRHVAAARGEENPRLVICRPFESLYAAR